MNKYLAPYYCPTCREFFNDFGQEESCVACGHVFSDASESCPQCGNDEFEMSCPKCGRFGNEQGLDHAECWAKDIAHHSEQFALAPTEQPGKGR